MASKLAQYLTNISELNLGIGMEMLTLPYSHKILENIIDWVVQTKCSRFGNQNYFNSPILVLYCMGLIIKRLKIEYLH